jgi:arylsulfatase A-like enzyme
VVHDQVRHVDLLPTLLDVTGIDIPAGIDGRSLAPLIAGGTLTEAPAYLEAVGVKLGGDRLTGARTPDFKLIRSSAGRAVLYRLNGGGSGPDEKHDQYRRYPEVAHQLEHFIDETARAETDAESGMTSAEEAIVEQHLRDLGYL